ncbi:MULTISPECIES: enoyl-CoA hydratase [unclassified Rhodococcus]|nr:enoyl-CoA hydratase [Rhodococcus sp. W8901]
MAIVALDSGAWCFGWIIGGLSSKGARVRSLARMPGEKYPTFTLAAPDDEGPSSSTS